MKLNSTHKKNNLQLKENDNRLQSDNPNYSNKSSNNISKYVWVIAGTFFTCLGILGIILPLLPATPFLLLAAFCYGKSSQRFYNLLLNNRWLGIYIKNYREKKGLSVRSKIILIIYLWVSLGTSAFFIVDIMYVKIILLFVGIGVTIYIILLKAKNL